MKYLKLYENWSTKMDDFLELRKSIQKEQIIINDLIYEFLIANYEELLPEYAWDAEINIDEFFMKNGKFTIWISWDEGNEVEVIELTPEQYKKFLYFMDNPDIYKNIEKYNI